MPFTISGVPSSLFSGRGPRLSVLNRHATSSLLKLDALICSSGEYLLPRKSAVYIGHSPFFVLGCPVAAAGAWARPAWPDTRGERITAVAALAITIARMAKRLRIMSAPKVVPDLPEKA